MGVLVAHLDGERSVFERGPHAESGDPFDESEDVGVVGAVPGDRFGFGPGAGPDDSHRPQTSHSIDTVNRWAAGRALPKLTTAIPLAVPLLQTSSSSSSMGISHPVCVLKVCS